MYPCALRSTADLWNLFGHLSLQHIWQLFLWRVAPKLVIRRRPRPSQYDGQFVQVEVPDVVLQLIPMLHIDVQECEWGLHLWNWQWNLNLLWQSERACKGRVQVHLHPWSWSMPQVRYFLYVTLYWVLLWTCWWTSLWAHHFDLILG